MRTVYKFVNSEGKERPDPSPYTTYEAKLVSVEARYNTDPEDPSKDELIVTLELVHKPVFDE